MPALWVTLANDPALLATDLADYLVLRGLTVPAGSRGDWRTRSLFSGAKTGVARASLEEFRRFSDSLYAGSI